MDGVRKVSIDPIEELLVANYLVNPDYRFKTMDDLRSWARETSKFIRRKINGKQNA